MLIGAYSEQDSLLMLKTYISKWKYKIDVVIANTCDFIIHAFQIDMYSWNVINCHYPQNCEAMCTTGQSNFKVYFQKKGKNI